MKNLENTKPSSAETVQAAQNQQGYIQFLEEREIKNLREKVKKLYTSMSANKKVFQFITDRNIKIYSVRDNKTKKIDKIVKQQLEGYDQIIAEIKEFKKLENCPFGEELQLAFFDACCKLTDPAIKYGYCKQACELLRIMKNPRLVGELAVAKVDDRIVGVASAYGKRTILGDDEAEIKESIKDLILGLKKKKYGDTKVTQDQVENAYRTATVRVGDTVLCMDGSHYLVKEDEGKGGK